MTEAYPLSNFYWECWVLVRRLVIAAVALVTYPQDNRMKFTFLAMCNVLFMAVHIYKRPYILVMDNYFESLSLVTLCVLCIFLIDAPNPLSSGQTAGLSAMCFIVGATLFARIILSRYERFVVDQSHAAQSLRMRAAAMAAAKKSPAKQVDPQPTPVPSPDAGAGTTASGGSAGAAAVGSTDPSAPSPAALNTTAEPIVPSADENSSAVPAPAPESTPAASEPAPAPAPTADSSAAPAPVVAVVDPTAAPPAPAVAANETSAEPAPAPAPAPIADAAASDPVSPSANPDPA